MFSSRGALVLVIVVVAGTLPLATNALTPPYGPHNERSRIHSARADSDILGQVEYFPSHRSRSFRQSAEKGVLGAPIDVALQEKATVGEDPDLQHIAVDRVVNNQLIHGHLFVLKNPLDHFSVVQPLIGCPGMIKTSVTAEAHRCVVAMNGGYFNMDTGQCLGNIISEGKIIQNAGPRNANFGIRKDGLFVCGYLSTDTLETTDNPFVELLTGVTWLVRNSTKYLDDSIDIEQPAFDFIYEKAPRTAIGHDKDGKLILLQIDGDEAIRAGVDLHELADLLVGYGAVNAVNLDGGGSSVTYYKGRIISKPSDHCPSGVGRCERMITTAICIR